MRAWTRELGRDALCFKGLPVIEPGREQCRVGFNLNLWLVVVVLQADEGEPTVS
jgi:hypothetical protein